MYGLDFYLSHFLQGQLLSLHPFGFTPELRRHYILDIFTDYLMLVKLWYIVRTSIQSDFLRHSILSNYFSMMMTDSTHTKWD